MPGVDSRAALETADRLFRTVEAGDIEALRSIYASEAVIWHNTDGKTESREQKFERLRGFVALSRNRTYTEIRREPTLHAFVQRHVCRERHHTSPDSALAWRLFSRMLIKRPVGAEIPSA